MTPNTPPSPRTNKPPYHDPLMRAAAELDELRQQNAEYKALTRATLAAGDAAPMISTQRMFYLLFAALHDGERRALLEQLSATFCLGCGMEYTQTYRRCSCSGDSTDH